MAMPTGGMQGAMPKFGGAQMVMMPMGQFPQGFVPHKATASSGGDVTFKPRVSCARTHALAQTTLKQTLEDLLGVHAAMIDVVPWGTSAVNTAEYIYQQVNHLGKACPAIKITLNVPNASKTLGDLTSAKDPLEQPSCAPGGRMSCLQIAKALGMEYLYQAVDPGFTSLGGVTDGKVETAFTV